MMTAQEAIAIGALFGSVWAAGIGLLYLIFAMAE